MTYLSWREWFGIIAVTALVAALTWTGLNVGKVLYADWAFLHMVRMNTEQQQRQQAAPQPAPPPAK